MKKVNCDNLVPNRIYSLCSSPKDKFRFIRYEKDKSSIIFEPFTETWKSFMKTSDGFSVAHNNRLDEVFLLDIKFGK